MDFSDHIEDYLMNYKAQDTSLSAWEQPLLNVNLFWRRLFCTPIYVSEITLFYVIIKWIILERLPSLFLGKQWQWICHAIFLSADKSTGEKRTITTKLAGGVKLNFVSGHLVVTPPLRGLLWHWNQIDVSSSHRIITCTQQIQNFEIKSRSVFNYCLLLYLQKDNKNVLTNSQRYYTWQFEKI